MEDHLLECFNAAIKAGESLDKRKVLATNHPAWDLLDKPWKGLLFIALNKDFGRVEGSSTKSQGRSSRRLRTRGRRGLATSTEDWIEGMEVLMSSKASPGYRLASMLAQKSLNSANWSDVFDLEIEKMRGICANGIHPVWARMGEESSLLAEMAVYPMQEEAAGNSTDSSTWFELARFDPSDCKGFSNWLLVSPPFRVTADIEAKTLRFAKSLSGKSKIKKYPSFVDDLPDEMRLVKALLKAHFNMEDTIQELDAVEEGVGADVAKEHLKLYRLRSGDSSVWNDCKSAKDEDSLSNAMRLEAWSNVPEDISLSSTEILEGLEIVSETGDSMHLEWLLVECYLAENDVDSAISAVPRIGQLDPSSLRIVLDLIQKSNDDSLIDALILVVPKLDDDLLSSILENTSLPLNLRSKATDELKQRGGDLWMENQEVALDIYTELGDAVNIANIMRKIEDGGSKYPHRTLLVYHLIPGFADANLCDWINKARSDAIEALANKSKGVLSDTAIGLVKLLEGAPAKSIDAIHSVLDTSGILALNQCRQAMLKGGDGLVASDLLDTLQNSIEDSEMHGVELQLFLAVLSKLRLNRALRLLENRNPESVLEVVDCFEKLVELGPTKFIVDNIRHIVLEHEGIALPNFAEWHRVHATSSPWHDIVRAAIAESVGKRQDAARSLRKASLNSMFDFEEQVGLGRRALINFAHAGKYSEAIDMLEKQPALEAALTGLFQLYLRVCDDAQKDRSDSAKRRLFDAASSSELISKEQEDGEIIEVQKTVLASDELDSLMFYPDKHGLPRDPWQGRVLSAIRGVRENRRSYRSQLEDRFRNYLKDGASVQDIESVAREAAETDPIQGLLMFERAMDYGVFDNREIRILSRSQKAIYKVNEEKISIRYRRKMRGLDLRPLVLLDTNLLIDAAKEMVGNLLDPDGGVVSSSYASLHRNLLAKAKAKTIDITIPNAVKGEFHNVMKNPERVRSLFGDIWLDEVHWVETVTEKEMSKICKQVLDDYCTWATNATTENIAEFEGEVKAFLLENSQLYNKVTSDKTMHNARSKEKRTSIDGQTIYPEKGDCDIMCFAAMLAETNTSDIGCILVASRDSDFGIVRRALEDSLGFGVIRNVADLGKWI